MQEMRHHLGEKADNLIAKIESISEEFAKVNVEFPYGELYTRDVLDNRVRELCTVAALTVQGFSSPQLKLHIEAALNCGVSREEIVEIITQMIAYAGFPAATNALLAAKEVFDEISKAGAQKTEAQD
jgi:4-carboxymuconolactone decarboxylase